MILPQNRYLRLSLEILLILLIYFGVRAYMQQDLVNGRVPDIQGTLLSGERVNLQSPHGEAVLLYFWATWCSVCKLQKGTIENLAKEHKVITIATRSGDREEVSAYLQENNLSFPVMLDEDGSIGARFGVTGVPTSFVIDANKEIVFSERGYTTNWGLKLRLWFGGKDTAQ